MTMRTVHCPYCGGKNRIEIDLMGIEDGGLYHQTENCNECSQPIDASAKATFEFGVGKIEWEEKP